jgi:hypothetical protein
MEKERLYSVIASLPAHLQTKVYDYALSLQTASSQVTPLVLNMHEGVLVIAEDFDAPLPDDFWLGTDLHDCE